METSQTASQRILHYGLLQNNNKMFLGSLKAKEGLP